MTTGNKAGVKRSPHRKTYSVFLGYQFKSTKSYYTQTEIRKVLKNTVRLAQQKLQISYPGVKLKLDDRVTRFGRPVNAQIVKMVKRASAGAFEMSERNPNVYFEMGLAYGRKVSQPILLLNKRADKRNVVASDVKDLFRLHYRDKKLANYQEEMASHIVTTVGHKIYESRYDLRRIWGVSGQRVKIVCPTLTREYIPLHSLKDSSEFVKFTRYGDGDALVKVLTLVRTLFPNVNADYVLSKEINDAYREDLIIIGGPDFNAVAKEFMKESKCPIQYRKIKGDKAAFMHRLLQRKYFLSSKIGKHEDYGLFARFPNPFNRSKVVIIIGGLGTWGVLGAVEAFENNANGRENLRAIIDEISENPHFAVLIPVRAVHLHTPLPKIDHETLCKPPWK